MATARSRDRTLEYFLVMIVYLLKILMESLNSGRDPSDRDIQTFVLIPPGAARARGTRNELSLDDIARPVRPAGPCRGHHITGGGKIATRIFNFSALNPGVLHENNGFSTRFEYNLKQKGLINVKIPVYHGRDPPAGASVSKTQKKFLKKEVNTL